MTTKARDEKWSEWVPVSGPDDMPANENIVGQWKGSDGFVSDETKLFNVAYRSSRRTVIAYRYRIQENEMHPDLKWLAENVSEWPCAPSENDGRIRVDATGLYKHGDSAHAVYGSSLAHSRKEIFTQTQWLRARKDLGLIMSDDEESLPAEEWSTTITDTPEEAAMVEDMVNGGFKQLRYQDTNGEDWIDEFARISTVDEFRGAMRFTIGKYNRRAGKKDELIKEIEKMRDYCDRWIAYERAL